MSPAPLWSDDGIRPALRGDPCEVAEWALSALAEAYGLSEAEIAIVADAIFVLVTEAQQAARRQVEAVVTGERRCAICGCSDGHACAGGCVWATENLCSRCV